MLIENFKLRAYNTEEKIYALCPENIVFNLEGEIAIINDKDGEICFCHDHPFEFEIYVGYKDINGKNIYENDIISFTLRSDKDKGKKYRSRVNFSGGMFYVSDGNWDYEFNKIENLEIVGNHNFELHKGELKWLKK